MGLAKGYDQLSFRIIDLPTPNANSNFSKRKRNIYHNDMKPVSYQQTTYRTVSQ